MIEAVLVGGASMFAGAGSTLEVGSRNEAAVREELKKARIKIVASATGGTRGRTVRVDPATGVVVYREAGAKDQQLYPVLNSRVLAGGGLRWPVFWLSTTPRSCARWCPTHWSRPAMKWSARRATA